MSNWSYIKPLANREPSLDEMMSDPIVQAVMARDSVEETQLRGLIARMSSVYRAPASRFHCRAC